MECKNITVKRIIADCRPEAEISDAIREAALIALQERRAVFFIHNGKDYEISPFDIVDYLFTKETTQQANAPERR